MGRRFESCRAHHIEVPRLRSGFRHAARTPRKRLKFESWRAHHLEYGHDLDYGRDLARISSRNKFTVLLSSRPPPYLIDPNILVVNDNSSSKAPSQSKTVQKN